MADDVHPAVLTGTRTETHFLPDPASAVADAARGLAMAHPADVGVVLDPLHLYARRKAPGRRVALVSGGGAGHEPMHAGFLGPGGLDAACPGLVFTSPHHRQVHEAARGVAGPGGVLLVVKNYTGDVICFAIAAERLRAEGVAVETVLVDDDLATDGSPSGHDGDVDDDGDSQRRGTAATVLVEKVLGAAADRGDDLASLARLGRHVASRARSLAVASRAQTSPATGEPAFELGRDELERGVGIHGERAASTTSRPPTRELVAGMLSELLAGLEAAGATVDDEGVALLVNGLGGATSLELHALRALVGDLLAERGVRVATSLVGTYTAALDMRGFSLTLLSLRPGWAELLSAPTATPSLPALPAEEEPQIRERADEDPAGSGRSGGSGGPGDPDDAGAAVVSAWARAVGDAHDELTRLDQLAGDGDFGDNVASGLAHAQRRGGTLSGAAGAFLDEVGGSSGPLLGLLLTELVPAVRRGEAAQVAGDVGAALRSAAQAVTRVGGAQVGDRTFLDALVPAADALAGGAPLVDGARAAVDGALGTAQLVGRRGRSRYLGDRALGAPDPGAVAVAALVVVIAQVLDPSAQAQGLPSPSQMARGTIDG